MLTQYGAPTSVNTLTILKEFKDALQKMLLVVQACLIMKGYDSWDCRAWNTEESGGT